MKQLKQTFSKGKYPINQVIYCGVDSVTGPVFTSIMFKPFYGKVDIIHGLVQKEDTDLEALLRTELPVVTTCWNLHRTLAILPAYCKIREWDPKLVRVYELAHVGSGSGLLDYDFSSITEENYSTVPRAIKFLTEYGSNRVRDLSRAAWFMSEFGEFLDAKSQDERRMEAMDWLLLAVTAFQGDDSFTHLLAFTEAEIVAAKDLLLKLSGPNGLEVFHDVSIPWNEKNVRKGRPDRNWDTIKDLLARGHLLCIKVIGEVSHVEELQEFNIKCSGHRSIIRAYNRAAFYSAIKLGATKVDSSEPTEEVPSSTVD